MGTMDEVDPMKRREADARELKGAILARLDQFRALKATATHHATAQPGNIENTIQLETTRATLLMDIRRLSALVLELEKN
ncbi:unnamed protein product [Clonostachys rosea]|uniref:Nas2 N-terminal domain-containing protein n=1 Tax=Bionectria ochroleuca TaxID=29856 RepID=A0ABY6U6V0_BIOOC|nr:unnamed protein product [Clonostachys rosea]